MEDYQVISIKGTVMKLNVDEKRATVTIEIAGESWPVIPKLTDLVGECVATDFAQVGD